LSAPRSVSVKKLVTLLLAALLMVSCNKPAEAPRTAVIEKRVKIQ
jgi:hypothetical protein